MRTRVAAGGARYGARPITENQEPNGHCPLIRGAITAALATCQGHIRTCTRGAGGWGSPT